MYQSDPVRKCERGRVLVAGDDETFLDSAAEALRREGYECDTARERESARGSLRVGAYDLLIVDAAMLEGDGFNLASALPQLAGGVPIVLVTATGRIAVEALRVQAAAYLSRPVNATALLQAAENAIARGQTRRQVQQTRQRLSDWDRELGSAQMLLRTPAANAGELGMDAFFSLALGNILGALKDMRQLAAGLGGHREESPCHMLNCPRMSAVRDALRSAVGVLEKTRSAFKSKDLGQLRTDLERLLVAIEP